ncbi:terpenoid synthase [Earliella scabrosa]|nr:terpenoid synthase [Earliella scabrosa]
MDVASLRPLPSHFRLRDIVAITADVFEFKINPHMEQVAQSLNAEWLTRQGLDDQDARKYTTIRTDLLAGMGFPTADVARFGTCLMWLYWAFSSDDLTDDGVSRNDPDAVQAEGDMCMAMLTDPESNATLPASPSFYASLLRSVWERLIAADCPNAYKRFRQGTNKLIAAQMEQARQRATGRLLSVEEFIRNRRNSYAWTSIDALVEYAEDVHIPDDVWDHAIMHELSVAIGDISSWSNDLFSFNKEQAGGDLQNLVFCVMAERSCGLQDAVDAVTEMTIKRVADYLRLKASLPSFGAAVDAEVARYLKGLEYYAHGANVWHYHSPRYFADAPSAALGVPEAVLPVHQRVSVPATQPLASQA